MTDLTTDIAYNSLIKHGELLCGDNVELIENEDGSQVLVLADGLGSGVKANILSMLTAKIISTMIAQSMPVSECVKAIAATLPVCEVRKVAYSTFTIMRISPDLEAEIIQYDNPHVILLRDGKFYDMKETVEEIDGKKIYHSKIQLREFDVLLAMSDGAIHAGVGMTLNYGWERKNIIEYMERLYKREYTAKMLSAILLEECNALYGDEPGDDTTVCAIKVRHRTPVNLMIGPPSKREDTETMLSQFFEKKGKHIVCGGTTSTLAAEFLGKEVVIGMPKFEDPSIPPTGTIDGVDLVTEGVITMSRVVDYVKLFREDNEEYLKWVNKRDGASLIAKMLLEDATDISFFVGRAINPAHQNPDLPINFSIKMRLMDELTEELKKLGKKVEIAYF